MFRIEDNVIYITRGDSAVFGVTAYIDGDSSSPYELNEGDYFTLTVRKLASKRSDVLFSVNSTNGRIVLSNEDTSDADVGKYSADIQLNMANGDRYTIWPKFEMVKSAREYNYKNFCIMPEVTTT